MLIIASVGCAKTKVVDFESEDIDKYQVISDVFKVGKNVTVNTVDGKRETFEVKAVSEDMVDGEKVSIPISDIVSVETVEATPLGVMCTLSIGLAIGWLYMAIPVAILMAFSGI